jgi:hypothetical protein
MTLDIPYILVNVLLPPKKLLVDMSSSGLSIGDNSAQTRLYLHSMWQERLHPRVLDVPECHDKN